MERVRVIYSKSKSAIFLDSKDLVCVFENSLKRAGVQIGYKDGKPDFILACPLPVGIESVNEFIDIVISEKLPISFFIKELNNNLPAGITCLGAEYIEDNAKSIDMSVVASVYVINFVYDNDDSIKSMTKKQIEDCKKQNIKKLEEYLNQRSVIISRKVENEIEKIDIKNNIKDVNILIDDSLEVTVDTGIRGNVNPNEIMDGFAEYSGKNMEFNVKRIRILYR